MPVEFLSDEDLALFGRFRGPPSQEDLDRVCFLDGADRSLIVEWLRDRQVLLPGVTVLARLVASVREATTARLWDTVAAPLTDVQRTALDELLAVRDGERVCDLKRLRRSPVTVSGPGMGASVGADPRRQGVGDTGSP